MKPAKESFPESSTIREISDLGAAAYLDLKGYQLLDVKTGIRGHAVFLFAVDEGALRGYFRDDDLVPPRKYLESVRSLKGLASSVVAR